MTSSTSSSVATLQRNSVPLILMPPLPATWISQPGIDADHADVLEAASAQLRGQPDTASFTLCGAYMRHSARSRSLPSPVESCVPKRHHSLPDAGLHRAQRLGVGVARDHAGMLRSAQTAGRSSFFTPSRSMRWPPVTLTVGILYLSTDVGDARAARRRGLAAPHARHDRVGAVLLDVGVRALVDEARSAGRPRPRFGPGGDQVVVERRAGSWRSRSACASPMNLHDVGDGQQLLLDGSRRARPRGCGRCSRTSASSSAPPSSRRRR